MSSTIYNSIFSLASIYILLKTIGFAIYEIKENSNKIGGFVTISFSLLTVVFFNFMIWFH